MTVLLRVLLGFGGALSALGAVWFFGSGGSYAGLVGGLAMLVWSVLWNAKGRVQLVSFTSLVLSILATGWMAATRLLADADAALVSISLVILVVICAALWVRQRAGL